MLHENVGRIKTGYSAVARLRQDEALASPKCYPEKYIVSCYNCVLKASLSFASKSVSEIQAQLTGGLTNVLSWLHANFLILNLEKTKIMLVGTHQRTAEADDQVIEISNTRLERVNKFKYLGVLLDNTLSWKDHIEYIGNKISSRLGVLRRARKVLPKPTCQMLYNTIVLPLFDYCSPVWDSCGVGGKDYLDKLNRRAACIIEGRSVGAEELKSTLGWPNLQAQKLSQMPFSP